MVKMQQVRDEVLNVDIIEKKYLDFSLKNVEFSILEGEKVALLGRNGNGKSTILKCILDIINYSGKISILGQTVGGSDDSYKEYIGVVFDEFCFNQNLNIVKLNNIMTGLYKNWDTKIFMDYVECFKLPLKKVFSKFSKGMKVKVSLAVALSHKAKVLVMDEPTSGLDPVFRREFKHILEQYIERENAAIIFSTHITGDVENFADRVILIKDGEVVVDDKVDGLFEKYMLYKGDSKNLSLLNQNNVFRLYEDRNKVEALLNIEDNFVSEYLEFLSVPTLDDIVAALCNDERNNL